MSDIISFIYKYGLIATCLIILIEYACFPISSEIVLPLSGAVAKLNSTSFFVILPLSVVSGLIGCIICFAIGRRYGQRCINKITRVLPASKKGIDASCRFFDKYGNKAVCIGRLIPLCRTYISFIAGISSQSLLKFTIFSTIGITIWNSILIGLGYVLGSNWSKAVGIYNNYKIAIIIAILITAMILLLTRIANYNRNKNK